jgi:nucleotide-binding universal stress UspA family protein
MRILVGVDGSESADRALEHAAKLAKAPDGRLKIVHVISSGNVALDELQDYALREHMTSGDVLNAFADDKLIAARQRAEALGAPSIETEAPWGDIAESIIAIADRDATDLIVLGKRGRGRLSGLILGSTSQKVVALARCAVTVVP